MLAIRFGGQSVLLLGLVALDTAARSCPRPGERLALAVAGTIGYGSEAAFYFSALNHGSAAAVTLLFYTYPVWVMLATIALDRKGAARHAVRGARARDRGQRAGRAGRRQHRHPSLGIVLALCTSVAYTAYLIGTDRHVKTTDPLTAAAWLGAGAAVANVVFARGVRRRRVPGRIVDVAARRRWSRSPRGRSRRMLAGLQRVGAVRNAIIGVMEPLTVAVLACFFLDEPLTVAGGVGGALILGGAVIASVIRTTRTAEPNVVEAGDPAGAAVASGHDRRPLRPRRVPDHLRRRRHRGPRGRHRARSHGLLRARRRPARRHRACSAGTAVACPIVDTVKSRETARPCTSLDPEAAAPAAGTAVTAEIDWDRRHLHMRTHTALHALSGVVFTDYGAKVTGGNMDSAASARMDFELDGISQEFGREVEEQLNARLAEDVPVHVSFLPRAEALADPDLIRTKVVADPRPRRPDPRDRHRGHRQAGRRRHARAFDRRGRPRPRRQDRVEGQGEQADADRARRAERRAGLSRRTAPRAPRTAGRRPPRPTVSISRSCRGIGDLPNPKYRSGPRNGTRITTAIHRARNGIGTDSWRIRSHRAIVTHAA